MAMSTPQPLYAHPRSTGSRDTTKLEGQDNTDVFSRRSKGWRLRLTKTSDDTAFLGKSPAFFIIIA